MGGKRIDECTSPEARALPTLDMALRPDLLRDRRRRHGRQHGDAADPRRHRRHPGPYLHAARCAMPPAAADDPVPPWRRLRARRCRPTTTTPRARALARAPGAVVVSAHYRQAPEHRFPAAHEDASPPGSWLIEHAEIAWRRPEARRDRRRRLGRQPGGQRRARGPAPKAMRLPRAPRRWSRRWRRIDVRPAARTCRTPTTCPYSHRDAANGSARKLFRDEGRRARPADEHCRPRRSRRPAAGDDHPRRASIRCARRARRWPMRCAAPASGSTCTLYEGVTHGFFGLYRIVNKAMFAQGQVAPEPRSSAFGADDQRATAAPSHRARTSHRRSNCARAAMVRAAA